MNFVGMPFERSTFDGARPVLPGSAIDVAAASARPETAARLPPRSGNYFNLKMISGGVNYAGEKGLDPLHLVTGCFAVPSRLTDAAVGELVFLHLAVLRRG